MAEIGTRRCLRAARVGGIAAAIASASLVALGVTAIPAGAQTPANAQLITVTGSSLSSIVPSSGSFTAAMTPAFSPTDYNYILNCPSGTSSVTFTMTAASGTITVNGHSGSSESATVTLTTDQAAVIQAPGATSHAATAQYWIRCTPTNFPTFKVVADTGKAPNGYYLTQNTTVAPGDAPYVMILDNHGTPVWWQETTPGSSGYFQQWNADSLVWDSASNGGTPNLTNAAGYTVYDLRTATARTIVPNNLPADGHAILHLSDGNILWLTSPEVTGVTLTSIGKGSNQNVANCVLQETKPNGKVLWTWNALQHIGVNESIVPISDTIKGQQVWDLFHCNAVTLQGGASATPEKANVVLSSRENSAIYLITRSTGNIIWKVSGTKPTATDPDASAQYITVTGTTEGAFYAQHNAQLSATGKLTLFDDHSGPPFYNDSTETTGPARGMQYQIDTTTGTATPIFSYVTPAKETTLATGSFNRYRDPKTGGTDNVIGWGLSKTFTTGGQTVEQLFSEINGTGKVMLQVDWLEPSGAAFPSINGSYRVIKLFPTQISLNLLRANMGGLAKA
jgi:hypothetical protein